VRPVTAEEANLLFYPSKNTWQADWREVSRDKNGNQAGVSIWRGNLRSS
jgi:hypothetical protein